MDIPCHSHNLPICCAVPLLNVDYYCWFLSAIKLALSAQTAPCTLCTHWKPLQFSSLLLLMCAWIISKWDQRCNHDHTGYRSQNNNLSCNEFAHIHIMISTISVLISSVYGILNKSVWVCFVLDFADAEAYTFGRGSTLPIVMDDVSCCGTESRLIDCTYDSHTSDCSHSKDAGVRCQPGWLTSFFKIRYVSYWCLFLITKLACLTYV